MIDLAIVLILAGFLVRHFVWTRWPGMLSTCLYIGLLISGVLFFTYIAPITKIFFIIGYLLNFICLAGHHGRMPVTIANPSGKAYVETSTKIGKILGDRIKISLLRYNIKISIGDSFLYIAIVLQVIIWIV